MGVGGLRVRVREGGRAGERMMLGYSAVEVILTGIILRSPLGALSWVRPKALQSTLDSIAGVSTCDLAGAHSAAVRYTPVCSGRAAASNARRQLISSSKPSVQRK